MCPEFEGPNNAPTAVDFFAGCGGFSLGLMRSGYRIQRAYEINDMARLTYSHHLCQANPISIHGDATNVKTDNFRENEIDVIVGGPPCQDFSANSGEIKHTERNLLPFVMIEWAAKLGPKVCVIENVEGMKHSHELTVNSLRDGFEEHGYTTQIVTLNAMDYGVPQSRSRVFIIAIREDINPPQQWKPMVTCDEGQRGLNQFNNNFDLYDYTTSSNSLGDLPDPLTETNPSKDDIHCTIAEMCAGSEENRYTKSRVHPQTTSGFVSRNGKGVWIPPNHVAADHSHDNRKKMGERKLGRTKQPTTSRRLDPEKPAPTLTSSNGTPPIHYAGYAPSKPDADVESVRRLTVREMARLQGFHDEFSFAGTKTEQFTQVANAVPPPMAYELGRHIRKNILEHDLPRDKPTRNAI